MKAFAPWTGSEQGRSARFYGPDVLRIATGFVNCYAVGAPDRWVLVDSGLPGFSEHIVRAVERRFGGRSRPAAMVLTHGHFDHAGSAGPLAERWQVPVYVHLLERPYLVGDSDYPPADPTVGGAIAFMSRVFPHSGRQLSGPVLALPEHRVPFLPEWRWLHTPGHTAGHISLFRDRDRLLLAGDALTTMNLDSWRQQIERRPELCRPPSPMTTDWAAARRSIECLAELRPLALGAGHGLPIAGEAVAPALERLARSALAPGDGRYVRAPARTGAAGLEWTPPPVRDRLAERAALLALAGGVAAASVASRRGTRSRD